MFMTLSDLIDWKINSSFKLPINICTQCKLSAVPLKQNEQTWSYVRPFALILLNQYYTVLVHADSACILMILCNILLD